MEFKPIGIIRSDVKSEDYHNLRYKKMKSEVNLYEEFSAGLEGIEGARYLWILYWMNRLSEKDRNILVVHPRGDISIPERGIFSTRSPARPNPIGLTKVKFVKRRGNVIVVEGLDALDGTPVVDIKLEGDYEKEKIFDDR